MPAPRLSSPGLSLFLRDVAAPPIPMARQWAASGQEVALLALIDTEHPRMAQNMSLWRKVKFHFTYLFDRIGKYTKYIAQLQLRKVFADVQRFCKNHAKSIIVKLTRGVFGSNGRNIPAPMRSVEMISEAAWHSYIPGAYDGPVLLLNVSERTVEFRADPSLGWRHCVTGPITIHIVPGDHLTVMHPPHAATLAARLKSYLDKTLAAKALDHA